MPYESILGLTPNQLLVLAIAHESDPPEKIKLNTVESIRNQVEQVRRSLGY